MELAARVSPTDLLTMAKAVESEKVECYDPFLMDFQYFVDALYSGCWGRLWQAA
jgi:hypothetical protein